jgi:Protein of unknown function (DUF2867)
VRLSESAHTSQPWRIHEFTRDFRVEDVWALPARGGRDEFGELVEGFARGSTSESPSLFSRALFAIRWKVGELLGWDDEGAGVGARVSTLRECLPADLKAGPAGPTFEKLPFSSLYLLENEWAAEIANKTMHGVLHLGWVPDPEGGYRGQMAVLVKPNGVTGEAYMAAIRPFRHLIVYPALLRQIEREWRSRATPGLPAHA